MLLTDLFTEIEYELIQGNLNKNILGITADSREVKENSLFFCIVGSVRDGKDYIAEALGKGAAVIVTEQPIKVSTHVTVILVTNIRAVMAKVSCTFYRHPADDLLMIGITGTKGKTTTAYMIYQILRQAGYSVGLIGTIAVINQVSETPSKNTTPESYILQRTLRSMYNQGIRIVIMEVSSQGLMMHRVDGITFDYGIFTNLSEDHIGRFEHKDFDEYKYWKTQLFANSRCSIINLDDAYSSEMIAEARGQIIRYARHFEADYKADDVKLARNGRRLGVSFQLRQNACDVDVFVGMPGIYTTYNALAAVAICNEIGVAKTFIIDGLKTVSVKGRMETLPVSDAFSVYIDYAHNGSSLHTLLMDVRRYNPVRVLVLFGCGGNRARQRRFRMGEVASQYADYIVLTNDNPRDEDEEKIIQDIVSGFHNKAAQYVIIKDRKEAIRHILKIARTGDIVILAGKGHETYQEIKGKRYMLDERKLVAQIMEEENVTTICGYNHRHFD